MNVKQSMPFLRWSFLRIGLGNRSLTKKGQIGDGRESAAADYVVNNARRGDIDDVLAAMDTFSYEKSMLISVGDKKGAVLGAAVRRADPRLALELGTYCGYSALTIARAAPQAKVFSVEFAEANAKVARRIWAHAGVDDRITCVVGTIGDGGKTLDALATQHGFGEGLLDFLFIRWWGLIGVAWSTLLCAVTVVGWRVLFLRGKFGLWPYDRMSLRAILLAVAFAAIFGLLPHAGPPW